MAAALGKKEVTEPIRSEAEGWALAAWQRPNGKWIVTATQNIFTHTETGEGADLEQALYDLQPKTDLTVAELKRAFKLDN